MGHEAETGDCDRSASVGAEARVLEWEIGLPSVDDLTPLSQCLIPTELAYAFSITPEPAWTMLDVHRASHGAISSICRRVPSPKSFPPADDPIVLQGDDPDLSSQDEPGEPSRKVRRSDAPHAAVEEADSSALLRAGAENSSDDHSARALKRPRLVWTPQLHRRFIDVVAHLGIKNAVPKTIMQLMNVDGLTRENVASHLQKYRLYLRKMQGSSSEGPPSSDYLFASTPVPQSPHEAPPVRMPMPYAVPAMAPMPVFAMPHHGHSGAMGIVPFNNHQGAGAYHGFESHYPYGVFRQRPNDWYSGNNFGSMASYPHVTPSDK